MVIYWCPRCHKAIACENWGLRKLTPMKGVKLDTHKPTPRLFCACGKSVMLVSVN